MPDEQDTCRGRQHDRDDTWEVEAMNQEGKDEMGDAIDQSRTNRKEPRQEIGNGVFVDQTHCCQHPDDGENQQKGDHKKPMITTGALPIAVAPT